MTFVDIRPELRVALTHCSNRGLKKSAKWAAELLTSVEVQANANASDPAFLKAASTQSTSDLVLLAKCFFDSGEYNRVAHTLRNEWKKGIPSLSSSPSLSNEEIDHIAIFLWGYSLYLGGEKRKQQEINEINEPIESCKVVNRNLSLLRRQLGPLYDEDILDGFGCYLYSMILRAQDSKAEARRAIIKALNKYPLIWSAWVDLAVLCTSKEILDSVRNQVTGHWMRRFFEPHVLLLLQENDEAEEACAQLAMSFGRNTHVMSQMAMVFNNKRKFEHSQKLFEQLVHDDPYRLEGMDTYSNILYVKECRAELSFLAHRAVTNDKYRPETCCIVGNYYSLKGNHKKAVLYFKRALRLAPDFLSAWTLMGHEYVELKQTNAAIEAYREAVYLDSHDYRAWYGLGQTYEILRMFHYALHYYRKACSLRPYDSRMWNALGGCFQSLEKIEDCKKCYRRALNNDPDDLTALFRLANVCKDCGEDSEAARLFERHIATEVARSEARGKNKGDGGVSDPPSEETLDALDFLMIYYESKNMNEESQKCCIRILDHVGVSQRHDKALATLKRLRGKTNADGMEAL
eukprot:g5369.t1